MHLLTVWRWHLFSCACAHRVSSSSPVQPAILPCIAFTYSVTFSSRYLPNISSHLSLLMMGLNKTPVLVWFVWFVDSDLTVCVRFVYLLFSVYSSMRVACLPVYSLLTVCVYMLYMYISTTKLPCHN